MPQQPIPNSVKGLLLAYGTDRQIYSSLDSMHISQQLVSTYAEYKNGEMRITVHKDYAYVVAICINDDISEIRRNVKKAINTLTSLGVNEIVCEVEKHPQEIAIASQLTFYSYSLLKTKKSNDSPAIDKPKFVVRPIKSNAQFDLGLKIGMHHNFARFLADTPANHMTPSLFVKYAQDFLKEHDLEVVDTDLQKDEYKKMELFFSVTHGSSEPCKFLRIKHKDGKIALIGKGITFDAGGLSLKPAKGMAAMKADMMGAATVLATMAYLADQKIDLGVHAYIPLCENLIGPSATKPGDVKTGYKSVEIDNTDAEGRLILADAITLAQSDKPDLILTIATLTGAIRVALGNLKIGMFTADDQLAQELTAAGLKCDEEVWLMPLDKRYAKDLSSHVADLRNVGNKGGGGSCLAAAFLNEFITDTKYVHLDIAGVMDDAFGFEWKGMTGKGFELMATWLTQKAKK